MVPFFMLGVGWCKSGYSVFKVQLGPCNVITVEGMWVPYM